jgi:outer membrane protein TolC
VVKSVQTAVDNGAAFRRSLDESKVELLKVEQNHIDLQSTRKNYLSVLGLFINRTIDESTEFETPPKWLLTTNINRPELKVYDFQKRIYDLQERQLSSDLQPKLSAFIQGGYSLPSLNFLSINPNFYYIGGLKLNWSLGSLYTHKNDKRILADNRKAQDIEQETFVFNTNQTLQKESDEVSRMIQMIEKDNDIIALRSSIKNAAKTQAQNGVITVHDYLTYVNDENRARQDLILHEVQLLFSQYNHKTASGN